MLNKDYNDLGFINTIKNAIDWLNFRLAFICGSLFALDGLSFKDFKAKFVVTT